MMTYRNLLLKLSLIFVTLTLAACATQSTFKMTKQERTLLLDKYQKQFSHTALKVGYTRHAILLNQATYAWFSHGTTLSSASKKQLQYIANIAISVGYNHIDVGGYSDNVGGLLNNERKSKNWAKSVYNYLRNQSIAKSKISFTGHGEFEPLTSNFTEAGRRENRRVEIKIT